MSGPKIDYVALERARAAELERKRQEKINAISNLDKERKESQKYLNSLNSLYEHYSALLGNVSELRIALREWEKIFLSFNNEFNRMVNSAMPSETEEIMLLAVSISEKRKHFATSYEPKIKEYVNRFENYLKNKENEIQFENRTNDLNTIEAATFSDVTPLNTKTEKTQINLSDESKFRSKEEIVKEIQAILNKPLPKDITEKLIHYYSVINKSEDQKSLEHNISIYESIKVAIKRDIREFSELFNRYNALISYVKSEGLFSVDTVTDFQCTEHLKNKVLLLEEKAKVASEQNYIKNAIHSVLKEFGHDICEEINFSENSSGYHMINYKQNSDNGIHTYVSENGKIMMEIVGVEHGDILSDNSSDSEMLTQDKLTETQKNSIYQNQILFCEQHEAICKKLKDEHGVILKCFEHMDSDMRFSKIIRSKKIRNKDKVVKKDQQTDVAKTKYMEIK